MLEKNKAFNTTGEFITLEGKELEREDGLAWFDTDIKQSVEDLVTELRETVANVDDVIDIIQYHFKVLKDVKEGSVSSPKNLGESTEHFL